MRRRRKKISIDDEVSVPGIIGKICLFILAPLLGFFSAYPFMRLIDLITDLF